MSEEVAQALSDLNTAQELWAALKIITAENARLRAELDAARAVVVAARQIDRHVVGAYETDSGSVEPCDECGEMREIACQALAAYDAAMEANSR